MYFMNEFFGFIDCSDRPPLISEYLPDDPDQVLKKVFSTFSRAKALKESLADWLGSLEVFISKKVGLNTQRLQQYEFYKALPGLIQALYDIERNAGTEAEMNHSQQVVQHFCQQFPRMYARREIWCFLNAAIIRSCDHPTQCSPDAVLEWYEEVSSLIEVAYIMSRKPAVWC
jgi:hypothetical protein